MRKRQNKLKILSSPLKSPNYDILIAMDKFIRFFLLLCILVSFNAKSFATQFANIEYDVPIDYSKIDKNALANQANLFFNHFEQITDNEYKKKYIQPLLNRYSVLSIMSPEDPFNFTRLGILYDIMGKDTLAKSNFYKATNLVPKYPYASFSFGNYYYKRGYYRKALYQYKMASGISYPYSYDRFMKMGSIYEKLGNYKTALSMYKAAYQEKNGLELYNKILRLEDLNSKNMLYH